MLFWHENTPHTILRNIVIPSPFHHSNWYRAHWTLMCFHICACVFVFFCHLLLHFFRKFLPLLSRIRSCECSRLTLCLSHAPTLLRYLLCVCVCLFVYEFSGLGNNSAIDNKMYIHDLAKCDGMSFNFVERFRFHSHHRW